MLNLAVFASGRGSNFEAILKSTKEGRLKAEVKVVISNRAEAGALEIARRSNIPALHIERSQFPNGQEFNDHLLKVLSDAGVNMIVLAGYLKKISPRIIAAYHHRILNIHPALLPCFGGKGMYGLRVHQTVLDSGAKVSGVSVHIIDEGYDTGPIVLQRPVPVHDDDTPETLAARVLKEEHKIYTDALNLFAEKQIEVKGKQILVKDRED